MQQTRLWIATALALVLGFAIWYTDRLEKDPAKPKPAEGAERLIEIPQDQLNRVELKRPAEESTIVLERAGNGWKMSAPQAFGVDADAVNGIVQGLAAVDSSKLVDAKPKDFAQYGFTAPRLILTAARKDGKAQTLEFANESPLKGDYYARLAGSPKLYIVAGSTYAPFDKRVPDLRDKRLVTFDRGKVKAIELQAKGATIEFAPKGEDWQIVKPSTMRADGLSVEEILRKISDARMDLNTKLDAAVFAAGTAVATVKVTDPSGAQTFELRRNKDGYYAKSSAVEGVHKLTKDVAESLDKDLLAFRGKKVFDFGFNELTRIAFRDGGKAGTYERKAADWLKDGRKVENVPALVDKLRDLSILRFLDAGMAAPAIEVTVTAGKRQEQVKIAKSGNLWVAQRDGSTELYEIDGKLMEDLQKAAAAIK